MFVEFKSQNNFYYETRILQMEHDYVVVSSSWSSTIQLSVWAHGPGKCVEMTYFIRQILRSYRRPTINNHKKQNPIAFFDRKFTLVIALWSVSGKKERIYSLNGSTQWDKCIYLYLNANVFAIIIVLIRWRLLEHTQIHLVLSSI